MDKKPMYKRTWFQLLLVLICMQLIFHFFELTGWDFKRREIEEGTFIGNLVDSKLFQHYFSFYENPWYNIITVFFGALIIIYIMIELTKKISNNKNSNQL